MELSRFSPFIRHCSALSGGFVTTVLRRVRRATTDQRDPQLQPTGIAEPAGGPVVVDGRHVQTRRELQQLLQQRARLQLPAAIQLPPTAAVHQVELHAGEFVGLFVFI